MRTFLSLLVLAAGTAAYGQIPQGYYNNADGLNGTALQAALFNIIKNHSPQSYNDLWTAF